MGDMLYMPAAPACRSGTAPFVSDDEVHRVVEYLKTQGGAQPSSRACSKAARRR